MKELDEKDLLKIPEIVEEIKRHLWIESERAGHDLGCEWAKNDWIKNFSKDWLAYHKPFARIASLNSSDMPKKKRRSAKSYLF